MSGDIFIDEIFRNRLPPLEKDEREKLKELILREGQIRNPLIYWQQENTLIDGHNRFEIYKELTDEGHSIKTPTYKAMSFASREEALCWIDDNARATRSLSERWRQVLIGREYLATKKEEGAPKGNGNAKQLGQLDPVVSDDRESTRVAKRHGVGEKSVRRAANRASVFDVVASEKGNDSEEAIAVLKVSQKVIDIAADKIKKNAKADEIVTVVKKEAAKAKKSAAKKKTSQVASVVFYEEAPDTGLGGMIRKAKDAGRLPEGEFWERIGGVTNQRWFREFVKNTHYMHLLEDDGFVELFIDDDERDLCTAIHKQLERMRDWSKQQNRFKYDIDMYKKTIQALYDLINKASTHK